MNTLILLAGGSGSRMRGTVNDKVLAPLGPTGLPVLIHAALAFRDAGVVGQMVIVVRDAAQQAATSTALETAGIDAGSVRFATGGAERRDSVMAGLDACPTNTELVFIHDGARPLIRPETLRQLAETAGRTGAAVLARRVTDTIKQVPPGSIAGEPTELRDLDRSTLWAMETPQVFAYAKILDAYRRLLAAGIAATDDVAAATHAGLRVTPVENLFPNPKITTPSDIAWCEHLLANGATK